MGRRRFSSPINWYAATCRLSVSQQDPRAKLFSESPVEGNEKDDHGATDDCNVGSAFEGGFGLMSADEPDYTKCDLPTLLDVEQRIDQSSFPERYRRLLDEIEKRRSESVSPEDDSAESPTFDVQMQTHIRTASVLTGILFTFTLAATLGYLVFTGLPNTLETLDVSQSSFLLATIVNVTMVFAAYDFYRGESWPRYVLWPISILFVISLHDHSIVSAYMVWVLYKTRRADGAAPK